MPGGEKLPKCPKGEVRDKKTKQCVKKTKKSPKKSSPKSPNTRKVSPKKASPKNVSVKKSPISIPKLSSFELSGDKYYDEYIEDLNKALLNDVHTYKGRMNNNTSFIYLKSDDLTKFVEKEIDKITKTHKSGEYTFATESRKLILKHLERYIKYFKRVADSKGRVNAEDIDVLYE
jgi:hypothetical protein